MSLATYFIVAEIVIAAVAVFKLVGVAREIEPSNHWKAKHLQEINAQIIWASCWGVLLSYLFAFNGTSIILTLVSCVLFMTFFYPFLSHCWISDWPGSRYKIEDHGKAARVAIASFESSMFLLGLATWAARANAGHGDGLIWGGAIFIVVSAVLLIGAAFSERMGIRN